jgi:hypothetical protein
MSNPNPQNPYPGYPQGGPPQPGDSRSMYPNSAPSPYPAAAGPAGGYGGPMSRRASSRTLPIIAGIGVAVGVFGGLMIIRGTGDSSAAGNPEVTENGEKPEGGEAPVLTSPDAAAAAVVATAEVDAAPKAVTPPEPETRKLSLRFDVAPKTAKIAVDGKTVKNGELTLELAADEKKEVEIEATAEGYEPWSKTVAVATTGTTQTVDIELEKVVKKPVTTSNTGTKKPPRPPREERKPPRDRGSGRRSGGSGGLIDL